MSKIRFHILLAALLVVTGCGEDDKVLPEQQQQFESFLSAPGAGVTVGMNPFNLSNT